MCAVFVRVQLHVRPDEHVAVQHGAHAASALVAGALAAAAAAARAGGAGGGGDARVDVGAVRRLRRALRLERPLARAAARLRLCVSDCLCSSAAARALSVAPAARARLHRRGLCAHLHLCSARASRAHAIAEHKPLTLLSLGIDVYGRSVKLILIARRSCLQAGARFHKRGVNSQVSFLLFFTFQYLNYVRVHILLSYIYVSVNIYQS